MFTSFKVKSMLLDVADIEGSKQAIDKAFQMNDSLTRFSAGEVGTSLAHAGTNPNSLQVSEALILPALTKQ